MEYLIGGEGAKSSLWVWPNYFPYDIYDYLDALPLAVNPKIVVYGKEVAQPRDVGFFSDESEGYYFSNRLMPSIPLSDYPDLEIILARVNESLGTSFNGILINKYRSGDNSIGAHSDSESGLDKVKKMVASIAFGETRKFRIRDKKTKKIVLDVDHQPLELLVMEGDFQSEYTHEIPKQANKKGRISLTFRHHIR